MSLLWLLKEIYIVAINSSYHLGIKLGTDSDVAVLLSYH